MPIRDKHSSLDLLQALIINYGRKKFYNFGPGRKFLPGSHWRDQVRRHDIPHNDTQHNDIQQSNIIKRDTQHKYIRHNGRAFLVKDLKVIGTGFPQIICK